MDDPGRHGRRQLGFHALGHGVGEVARVTARLEHVAYAGQRRQPEARARIAEVLVSRERGPAKHARALPRGQSGGLEIRGDDAKLGPHVSVIQCPARRIEKRAGRRDGDERERRVAEKGRCGQPCHGEREDRVGLNVTPREKCEIQSSFTECDGHLRACARRNRHAGGRVALRGGFEHDRKAERKEILNHADPQLDGIRPLAGGPPRGVDAGEDVLGVDEEFHAEGRKLQATPGPLEERRAQIALERGNLKTDGGFAPAEQGSGTRYRAEGRRSDECPEALRREVGNGASSFPQDSFPRIGRRGFRECGIVFLLALMEATMPFLRLTIQPSPDETAMSRLSAGLTTLMAETLGKKAELTSVLVEAPQGGLWTIGAVPAGRTAVLEAAITQGTNDDEEKADFIAAAHALLARELPDLSPVAYVILTEIPAQNWGYDGQTQAKRRMAPLA